MLEVLHMQIIKKNIIVLGKDFFQGLTTTGTGNAIYTQDIYKYNFTTPKKTFVLSLHYNGNNSYLFVNGGQKLQFTSQTLSNDMKSKIFCIGNFSSDWSSAESTKTGLYGNVYDFAIDYEPLNDVKTIHDIHRYLMKKHNIV